MLEVVGLGLRAGQARQRLEGERRAASRAALVEQQYVILLHRAFDPAAQLQRPRRGGARPALEEDEPGALLVACSDGAHRARKNLNLFATGPVVVERNDERMVGQGEAGNGVGGHGNGLPLGRCVKRQT